VRSVTRGSGQAPLTEKDLLLKLLKTDPKPNECHQCGISTDLTRHRFAFAKLLSVKREWGETLARAGLSAVSIVAAPVTGFGVFSWKRPNKTTSYKLFPAELVLCRSCLSSSWKTRHSTELKQDTYCCHPWAELARRIGYDKYLSADELATCNPPRYSPATFSHSVRKGIHNPPFPSSQERRGAI
jgi:hypothetical protein